MTNKPQPRHFLDLPDIAPEALIKILDHAHRMKAAKYTPPQLMAGLSLAMLFDKKSTRTRMSFEVAMKQLGGHTIPMNMGEMQITGAESIEDTANVLSRYVDAVMIRMSDHDVLCELADHCRIPIINGLTDWSHPCQIMADMMTIEEKLGGLKDMKIGWFGDYNNVARTYAQAASIWGFKLFIAAPEDLHPDDESYDDVIFTRDAKEAAADANVIVTDTWVSMGEEGKSTDKFKPYQVNKSLMTFARPEAIFMHCMPIHRGYEVTDDVLNSPQCVIYDEAENRLHAQKAILAWCLENAGVVIE